MKQRLYGPLIMLIVGQLACGADMTALHAEEASTTAPPSMLSLDECIQRALTHQPKLQQVQSDLDVAQARIRQAWSTVLPHVNASASYTYASVSGAGAGSTSSGGSATDGHTTMASATVTQTLWDFGRSIARIKQGRADQDAARWQTLSTRQATILTATQAYLTVLEAQGAIIVAEQAATVATQQLQRTRGFAEEGLRSRAEVLTAEVALRQAEFARLQAQHDEQHAKYVLNEAMGGFPDIAYRVTEPALVAQYATARMTLEEALTSALAQRPELHRAAALEQSADADMRAVRRGWLPTLKASGGYSGRVNDATDYSDVWSATLAASWDVWDGGLTTAQTAEARAKLQRSRAEREDSALTVTREVQESWLRARELIDQIRVGERLVAEAEERLRLTEGRYAAGLSSALEVTDASHTLAAARQTLLAARTDAYVAQVQLRYAIGEAL